MKLMFCTDKSLDRKNYVPDGSELAVEYVPEEMKAAYQSAVKEYGARLRYLDLPGFVRMIEIVSVIIGMCFLVYYILVVPIRMLFGSLSLSGVFREIVTDADSIGLFSLGLVCTVAAVVIITISKRRSRDPAANKAFAAAKEALHEREQEINSFLSCPEDAATVDILTRDYSRRDGEIVRRDKLYKYELRQKRLFCDEDTLYITDFERKYAVPKSCITGIAEYDCEVELTGCSIEMKYDKGKYAGFVTMKKDKANTDVDSVEYYYVAAPLYALCFGSGYEDYLLPFPNFELETMQQLTGIYETEKRSFKKRKSRKIKA